MRRFQLKPCSLPRLVPIACAVVLASCGTPEAVKESSTTALSSANSALEEANNARAATYAPSPWAQAREKLSAAQEAMRVEEYRRAEILAEEARVDAELAEAQARAALAEESVDDLQNTLEALRQEATESEAAPTE